MKMSNLFIALVAFVSIFGFNSYAQSPTKNIVENISMSEDHSTLVSAIKAASLAETLSGKGSFTILAPSNNAFAKLPAGTVENLLKPENVAMLQAVLSCHVLAGKFDSKAITAAIKKGNGTANLVTLKGVKLTAVMNGDKIEITDENGAKINVTNADIMSSNGIIHVTDGVATPKS
jgi:uncharacterized surface protein with fasciclin (FAS1) repeats